MASVPLAMDSVKLHVTRFSGPSLRYGVVDTEFEGVPAKITTPARTVVDCFRFRRRVGLEAALEAFDEVLRERKATPDEIWRAAEACRRALPGGAAALRPGPLTMANRDLRPYPAYKDSGVEWLGEIPAHWEVEEDEVRGHTAVGAHAKPTEAGILGGLHHSVVRPRVMSGRSAMGRGAEYVHETAEKISEIGLANSSARLLPKGTVILSRTASVGFSANPRR